MLPEALPSAPASCEETSGIVSEGMEGERCEDANTSSSSSPSNPASVGDVDSRFAATSLSEVGACGGMEEEERVEETTGFANDDEGLEEKARFAGEVAVEPA